jgi:hypothetical protein
VSEENKGPAEVPVAPHRWAEVERLAAKYMNGDTTWMVDQAIELVSFLDMQDEKNLARLFDDLLEQGAEGLTKLHSLLDRAAQARRAPDSTNE